MAGARRAHLAFQLGAAFAAGVAVATLVLSGDWGARPAAPSARDVSAAPAPRARRLWGLPHSLPLRGRLKSKTGALHSAFVTNELRELALSHKRKHGRISDKFTLHTYETMYGLFLSPLVEVEGLRVLEIANGCTRAHALNPSIAVWREYLPYAEVWAADANQTCIDAARRRNGLRAVSGVLTGPQGKARTLREWVKRMPRGAPDGGFDVIIDDGTHRSSDVLRAFDVLWNEALNPVRRRRRAAPRARRGVGALGARADSSACPRARVRAAPHAGPSTTRTGWALLHRGYCHEPEGRVW